MPKVDESLIKAKEPSLQAGALKYTKKEMYKIEAFRKILKQGKIPGEARGVRLVERTDKKTGKKYLLKMNPKKYPVPNLNTPRKAVYKQVKLRASVTPGTIGILLKGNQRAKRVIFLKQIDSGLLLVCNPVNQCAPRTIDHKFFLATKMKVDVSGIQIPEEMNHTFFHNKRAERKAYLKALRKSSILGGDKPEKKVKALTPEKLAVNKKLEDQLTALIEAHPEGAIFKKYMRSLFKLGPRDYPHKMQF